MPAVDPSALLENHEPLHPMPRFVDFLRVFVLALLIVASGASCADDQLPLSASGGRVVSLNVVPVVQGQSGGSVAIAITQVRVLLTRPDGSVALDTTVNFPSSASELSLALPVLLSAAAPAEGEELRLTLEMLNAAGAVVYLGGPLAVRVRTGEPLPPVEVPLRYAGPGANATRVVVEPTLLSLEPGAPGVLVATAYDASNAPLPGTPVLWSSSAPAVVAVPNPESGQIVAGPSRGTAVITARLLSGQTATASITVRPVPTLVAAVSGSGQGCTVGGALGAPLAVRVTSASGAGVDQVAVAFAVQSGGGTVGATSVVTGSDGTASTTFTAGVTPGPAVVHATVDGLAGSPVIFSFTCLAGAATQAVFIAQPSTIASGATMTPVVVEVRDAFGNRATGASGTVSLALDAPPAGVVLGGTTTATIVDGRATFGGVVVTGAATGLRLRATAGGVSPATSAPFDVQLVPAVLTRLSGDAQACRVGTPLAASLVARVTTASGVPVPGVGVTFGVTSGVGVVGATAVTTATDGTAATTFTPGTTPGSAVVQASVNGLAGSPVSFSFTCGAGEPTQLVFVTQPANALSGAPMAPVVVELRDGFGNRVTAATGTMGIALEQPPVGVVLTGPVTATIADGRATFTGLVVTGAATGLRLRASLAGGPVTTLSAPFTIFAPVATGMITGSVVDGRNGEVVPGATVSVEKADDAVVIATQLTDAGGSFTFSALAAGMYKVRVNVDGFAPAELAVPLGTGETATVQIALSSTQEAGTVSIVLTWGADPSDLDSYVIAPDGEVIFFGNVGDCEGIPFACLDRDDVNSFGPETMTITKPDLGTWVYAVNIFAGTGTFATSPALVQVYIGNVLVRSYAAPAGVGAWWTVFSVNGTTITDINTLSKPPALDAGASGGLGGAAAKAKR
jgi:hypothetical protein